MERIAMWEAGNNRRQRGFTLLELMVVMVIATVLLGMVSPRLFAVLPGVELKTSAQNVAAMLRLARSQSIAEGKVIALEYDEFAGLSMTGREQPFKWSEGIKLELQVAQKQLQPLIITEQVKAIYFYPDGSSSGGILVISSDAGEYRISVHWLTGKVSFHG